MLSKFILVVAYFGLFCVSLLLFLGHSGLAVRVVNFTFFLLAGKVFLALLNHENKNE